MYQCPCHWVLLTQRHFRETHVATCGHWGDALPPPTTIKAVFISVFISFCVHSRPNFDLFLDISLKTSMHHGQCIDQETYSRCRNRLAHTNDHKTHSDRQDAQSTTLHTTLKVFKLI